MSFSLVIVMSFVRWSHHFSIHSNKLWFHV